jgi:hypothetical protein
MSLKLDYLEKPKLNNPVMIAGLPGIANVGKLAVEFLINQLKAKKFLELHSEYFPEWAIPDAGGIRTLKMDFFHVRPDDMKYDLILTTADAQAATPHGQYALTEEILNIAEEHGTTTVSTMAAYVLSMNETRKSHVVGVATNPKLSKTLKEKKVKLLDSGVIVGMNGLLPAFAALKGMDGFCLLGVTEGGLLDPNASVDVLQAMASIVGFSVDTTKLAEHADSIRSKLPQPQVTEAPEDEVTYIR